MIPSTAKPIQLEQRHRLNLQRAFFSQFKKLHNDGRGLTDIIRYQEPFYVATPGPQQFTYGLPPINNLWFI
jgi:hypothetical protein